jgi:hypothetical protein
VADVLALALAGPTATGRLGLGHRCYFLTLLLPATVTS